MGVIRCENGHFYDDSLYQECPHCRADGPIRVSMRDSATVAMNEEIQQYAVSYMKEQREPSAAKFDEEKTIALVSKQLGNDFVAGWLVCTDGPEKGREYSLYHGFNRIGRAHYNDISLSGDGSVSREPQCAVVYENRKNVFYAVPQIGGASYLNDVLLEQAQEIKTGDRVKVGKTELTFIAFCEGERKW